MPMVVPKLLTFLISALIHELIITYALGFFYPILFILFTGPGIFLLKYRYPADSESEESEINFSQFCILAGNVHWNLATLHFLPD